MRAYILASMLLLVLGVCMEVQASDREEERDRTSRSTSTAITANVSGTQGANGWYTSDVTITWNITGNLSQIKSKSGCDRQVLTEDTTGKSYTCQITTNRGSVSKSVTVKRDATPPKITIVSPENGGSYSLGQTVKAQYSCTDSTSGTKDCQGTKANGDYIDLSSAGTDNFTVLANDQAGNSSETSISYTVGGSSTGSNGGSSTGSVSSAYVFAWNDLGMHCADTDYSVFTLLPPFNNLNAQLLVNGKLVGTTSQSSYSLTYKSTADPTGSINTTSLNKTNFWDYAPALFGANLAINIGLTGNPAPSYTPAAMDWNPTYSWYEATGIPITPIDDNQRINYYPMVKVTALDANGNAIVSNDAVLPISNEINCNTCHASNTGNPNAKPTAGWVDLTPGSEQDWRLNILRLHDEKNKGAVYTALLTKKGYGTSLEFSARNNAKPILCDTCHNSNALAVWGFAGESGVSSMSSAIHKRHANVTLPGSSQTLDSIPTRQACYNCHPGEKTQCLRGAMGNPVDSSGNHIMECQSCHGKMATVGNPNRQGWLDMPYCQACHHDGKRETVAINADGTFKVWSDTRFATNPDTPSQGLNLYRYSTGHGKMQCEACHNSTHAEYTSTPSANGNQANDNLQAIKAQGYAAAIRECTVCHEQMPSSINGGPHGMHNLGNTWVSRHHDAFGVEPKSVCFYCHGNTSSGSPLAVIKIAKTFNMEEGRTKTFAAGDRVTCWSCHNGPNP